jgi:hypothetical protein
MAERTTPEQDVQYKSLASGQLTQALLSLWAVERLCEKCAANTDARSGLLRDAIVLYSGAFKGNRFGGTHSVALSHASYIPKQFEQLHNDLIAYSDNLFAHVGSEFRSPRQVMDENRPLWQRNARGSADLEAEIPHIKALILEIVCQRLWPEILDEHHEPAGESDL